MSGTSSALGEAAFAALPKTLQAKIDDAFNSQSPQTVSETCSPFADAEAGGGGFLVEDAVVDEAQGNKTIASACISLASIPAALELLELPPDDRQILAVFRDAAESDHEDDSDEHGADDGKELTVSRGQWRAVCAVLLEGSSPSPSQSESGDDSEPYVASDDSDRQDQGQDKYQYDDDDDAGDDSDGEYTGHAASASKLAKSSKGTKWSKKPSALRNSQASLDAFALFFPSIPRDSDVLKEKKIMLKDLQAAMKRAGDKYKGDEVHTHVLHCADNRI